MPEAYLHAVRTEDPGMEEPAVTRERLRDRFPRGATRRMTQLGIIVGSLVEELKPSEADTVVYASGYAESRALESYLDSFPLASPTLFQTSIHPSAVQQVLIARQQPIGQLFPMTGGAFLVAHALQVALLATTPRVLVCGGEERGTWLLDEGAASARTFAFAFSLTHEAEGAIGRLSLERTESSRDTDEPSLNFPHFFDALHERRSLSVACAPELALTLSWK